MEKINVLCLPSDSSGVGKFRSVDPHVKLQNMYPNDFHVDIEYNPNLNLIYATVNASIIVIDPNTLTYTQQFPTFPSCCCEKTIMYNSVNSKIYVSDPCSNQIYEIDELTYSIVTTGATYGCVH